MIPVYKLVRHAEVEAFRRVGWTLANRHIPRLDQSFTILQWDGDGEPMMPVLPPLRRLRRGRIAPTVQS